MTHLSVEHWGRVTGTSEIGIRGASVLAPDLVAELLREGAGADFEDAMGTDR